MKNEERSASDVLEGVVRDNNADYFSFLEIKMALHERGFGLLMLFFTLPLSIPLPIPPGLTMVPAIPLIIFSIQMMRGMDSPWLPKWIGARRIKRSTVALVVEKTAPYLKRVEKLMRPRFSLASSASGEKIIGLFALLFSVAIFIPLPFIHMVPAIGILLMSLGLLSKDGVPIIMGMIVGSMGIAFAVVVVLLEKNALMKIVNGIVHYSWQ